MKKTYASKNTKSTHTPQKIFIGVSWPYASGSIHLGHLAGQYVVCDIFARYHRLKGNKVLMVSGSDCHGAPVIFAAEEQGITPEELARKSHKTIVETYKKMGFLYENYTLTHTKNHEVVSQNMFLILDKLGFLKVKTSKQYYDPKAKRFLPDRYVRGTCPFCKATNARGDECPECGEMLDPTDLMNPYSTISDSTPILKETKHYYLDLKKTEPALKKWLKDKTYWRKWVKEFTDGWLKGGLRPRAVTRDFSFGVPVPVKGWEHKVLYVWLEAVIGYLSAAIEWGEKRGNPSEWESFWKDPSCKHYYFIAGGNVPFHTIIWPAEIIGYNGKYADDKLWKLFKLPGETKRSPLVLPYDVPANNMLTYRGRKMSKGDKTGIGLDPLLETYGPDLLRYFFARFAPETDKRELTWKDFIDSNNNELVANLGNFVNRVLTFTSMKFNGTVPQGNLDNTVKKNIDLAFSDIGTHIEKTEFVRSIESLLAFGHFANKYFNDERPWETITTDSDKASNSLYNSLQIVSAIRTLLKPFLSFASQKLANLLNVIDDYDPNAELEKTGAVSKFIDTWKFNTLPVGHKISEPEVLFPKHEYSEVLQNEDNPQQETIKVTTKFSHDLSNIDPLVVVGKIVKLKENRLVSVDINHGPSLSIVCGDSTIKKGQIIPVALPGATVFTSSNEKRKIKVAKIGGVNSEGMLCSPYELGVGEDHEHILILPKEYGKHLGAPVRNILPEVLKK